MSSKEDQTLKAEIEQLLKAEEERARKAEDERLRRAKKEQTLRAEIERLQRAEEEQARKAEEERLRKVETTVSPQKPPLLLQASAISHVSTNVIESEGKYLGGDDKDIIKKTGSPLVSSGVSIDGKKVLERVKQGKAPPSWQVHTDPDTHWSSIVLVWIGLITLAGLVIGAVVVVATLLHLQ